MNGKIKKFKGVYPVTVMSAVYVDGTNKTLKKMLDSGELRGPQGPVGPTGAKGETGSQGPQGQKGDTGDRGPTGSQGPQGLKGDTGATFKPNVDREGNITWSNDKGLPNPSSANIKGPRGDIGERGPQGLKGETGSQGPKGEQGPPINIYSTLYSYDQQTIENYSASTYEGEWETQHAISNEKVGNTVGITVYNTDREGHCIIYGKITNIISERRIRVRSSGGVINSGKGAITDVKMDHDNYLGTLILGKNICIQWGYFTIRRGNTWEKININRPYKDNNYNIQVSPYYKNGHNNIYVGNVEKSCFHVSTDGDLVDTQYGQSLYWFCIGEIDPNAVMTIPL